MNAYSPQAYTIPGVDSMPTDIATQLQLAPLLLAPVGAKVVALDFGWCTSSLRLTTSGLPGDRHSGKRRRREGHHVVTAAL